MQCPIDSNKHDCDALECYKKWPMDYPYPPCDNCGQKRFNELQEKIEKMKTCWYKAIVGVDPNKLDCKRQYPNGCYGCSFFMPDPPEQGDRYSEKIQDELVQLMIEFLEKHDIYELLELVTSAVAKREQQ